MSNPYAARSISALLQVDSVFEVQSYNQRYQEMAHRFMGPSICQPGGLITTKVDEDVAVSYKEPPSDCHRQII